jgi:hypothetical protein
MPPKRKREQEPGEIIYGNAVPWLLPLINKSFNLAPTEDLDPNPRDPSLTAFTDDEVIWQAAKVIYLLDHTIEANGNLSDTLQAVGIEPDTSNHKAWVRKISLKQTQWKAAVLNKFMFDHVKETERKWLVANVYRTFGSLSTEDREKIWMDAYDTDPKRIITSMWKPVIGVLDIANIFNPDCGDEDRIRMNTIRTMFRDKYLYGCQITYKNRIEVDRRVRKPTL